MNGMLIYLMGPSGVGKDSLLTALRRRNTLNHQKLLIAHRYITRNLEQQDIEKHVPLDVAEFSARREHELFALHWSAHGLEYGIGIEVDVWIKKGFSILVNGSRQHLPHVRAKYDRLLMPVCLVASASTLGKRLRQRGRENDAEIELRLERALQYQYALSDDCFFLHNEGDIEDTADNFLKLLQNLQGVAPSRPRMPFLHHEMGGLPLYRASA